MIYSMSTVLSDQHFYRTMMCV